MTDVDLAIRMTADAREAVSAAGDAGNAYSDMAREVDAAADKSAAAGDRMANAAEGADALGSKSSQAAGGLGDLGGALSAMPGPLGALGTGMETLAPSIMGVTGAMDLANLALESNVVVTAKAKAAAAAKFVVDKSVMAATKTWTAIQWLLNAALSANPIGIVVVAVAALVAGIVLAYNKSETFRNVVQAVMGAAKTAVGWVVDKLGDIVGVVERVANKVPSLQSIFSTAGTLIKGYVELWLAPLNLVKDAIQWIIDKLASVKVPSWLGKVGDAFGRTASVPVVIPGQATSSGTSSGAATVNITVQGAYDPYAVAYQLVQLLQRYGIAVTGVVPA